MNRRRFVSLLAATPIGIWASTKIGKAEPVPAKEEERDSPWDTQCVATKSNEYDIQPDDEVVLCGSGTKSLTLPIPKSNQIITISASHGDVVVDGKWHLTQGQAAMFATGGNGWSQIA